MGSGSTKQEVRVVPIASLEMPMGQFEKLANGIVVVQQTSSVADATDLLTKYQISSLPVYKTLDDSSFMFCGFCDYVSIVLHTLNSLSALKQAEKTGDDSSSEFEQGFHMGSFKAVTLEQINTTLDPFVAVTESDKLEDVMRLLGRRGLHRVAVVDDQRQLVNLVTQSHVAQEIMKSVEGNAELRAALEKTVEDYGLHEKADGVFCVELTSQAVDAFQYMDEMRVLGVGVVDSSGALVGNISNRDVEPIVREPTSFRRLFARDLQVSDIMDDTGEGAVCVQPSTSMGQAVQHMLNEGVHRIYVTQPGTNVPVGIITFTDVLAVLCSDPPIGEELQKLRAELATGEAGVEDGESAVATIKAAEDAYYERFLGPLVDILMPSGSGGNLEEGKGGEDEVVVVEELLG